MPPLGVSFMSVQDTLPRSASSSSLPRQMSHAMRAGSQTTRLHSAAGTSLAGNVQAGSVSARRCSSRASLSSSSLRASAARVAGEPMRSRRPQGHGQHRAHQSGETLNRAQSSALLLSHADRLAYERGSTLHWATTHDMDYLEPEGYRSLMAAQLRLQTHTSIHSGRMLATGLRDAHETLLTCRASIFWNLPSP